MAKIGAVQEVRIEDLKPYERNAKLHSEEQIEKIAASIEEFGFLNPCLIDEAGNIIAGHGRVEAAKLLGLKKVPCLNVKGLSEEQRRAYILADNRLTELGEWDMDLVNQELQALSEAGFEVEITGFDWDQAAILDPIEEPYKNEHDILDPIEEKPEEDRTKRGDVWELGEHRLVCGDSTDPNDVAKLFQGEKANFVFTDPPYGVSIGDKNKMLDEVGGEKWTR